MKENFVGPCLNKDYLIIYSLWENFKTNTLKFLPGSSPLTFHGDLAGVGQQRQGEQKQEIHHWQTIVAEQRCWDAEERTQNLNLADRNDGV